MALETSAESPAPLRQISALIGGYIGKLGAVWIEAEVAQLNRRRGISFLTLRDLEAKISISATCHISVLDAAPAPVTEGARVVVHAKPSFYEPSGSMSLAIREIRPAGEGELLAQLERRKQLLAAEGLFDPRLKRPLPLLPSGIGLITGANSAAERDVIENVRLRWTTAPILTRHALMQGPQSAIQVIQALEAFNDDPDIDLIVIARGGGSIEDLLPFSDEALIRAVHASTTAVVSAIGHEPDTPILDLVADLRASTPTDAAKRIVPDEREERAGIAMMRERSALAITSLITRELATISALRSRPVLAQPATVVDAQQTVVTEAIARTRRALDHRLTRAHDEIGHHLARVRALSPLATMQRGYAVVLNSAGQAVTSTAAVKRADPITVQVTNGRITARIEHIEENAHD